MTECRTCAFWGYMYPSKGLGLCYVRPMFQKMRPLKKPDDSCDRHEPRCIEGDAGNSGARSSGVTRAKTESEERTVSPSMQHVADGEKVVDGGKDG